MDRNDNGKVEECTQSDSSTVLSKDSNHGVEMSNSSEHGPGYSTSAVAIFTCLQFCLN